MNLFIKNCLRLSGIAILLGIILIFIAYGSGATLSGADSKDFNFDFTSDYEDEITSISMDLTYGNVSFKRGDKFRIEAEDMNKESFNSYVEDGTWHIEDSKDYQFSIFGLDLPFINIGNDIDTRSKVVIYIPEDFQPDSFNIEIGAGKVTICDLDANEVDFEVGAGLLEAERLNVSGSATFEVGAGKMSVENLIANDSSLSCGLGEMVMKGDLKGDSTVECGLGHIKLELAAKEADYDFLVDCGLGNVSINGSNYSFTSSTQVYGDNAQNEMSIECGVGGIEVDTAE
jgi:hypothetical protein